MANDREQFDVSSFLSSFDKEFTGEAKPEATAVPETQEKQEPKEPVAQATPPTTEEQVETPEQTEELPAETQPAEEPTVEAEQTSSEPINDPDVHKRNEAFKKLREEKQKLEQSDIFLTDLASQYGLTKEELVEKFKNDRVKKEAEKQGVPIEQYKRMQQLEQEVQTIKQRYSQETFNYEADRLVQKYNIPANQVDGLFQQIGALGIDVLSNPKLLEVAYKALNYDVALQKGRQAQLEETKKRRETTASPSLGTKGTNVDSSDADIDAEIDAFLKEKIGR
jgi:hypothetical protein